MGGNERIHQDDYIAYQAGRSGCSEVVERWLQNIRSLLPPGADLSATVRSRPQIGFFASFRLSSEGEVTSSEARADTLEEAVEKAGRGLCRHLPFADQDEDLSLAG